MPAEKRRVCSPEEHETQTSNACRIPTRSGLELGATITRPTADGKFPVLVWYDPYRSGADGVPGPMALYFARRGYAFVNLNVRGTGNSQGISMVAMNALPPFKEAVGAQWSELWRQRLEQSEPYLLKWIAHQVEDEYWAVGSIAGHYHQIRAASLTAHPPRLPPGGHGLALQKRPPHPPQCHWL